MSDSRSVLKDMMNANRNAMYPTAQKITDRTEKLKRTEKKYSIYVDQRARRY